MLDDLVQFLVRELRLPSLQSANPVLLLRFRMNVFDKIAGNVSSAPHRSFPQRSESGCGSFFLESVPFGVRDRNRL